MLSTSLIRIKLEGNAWEEIRGTKVKEKIKGIVIIIIIKFIFC